MSGAHDESGYGTVSIGVVPRNATKKPRTTYAPTVGDPKSQQPLGNRPGAGLPASTRSVTRGNPATSQAAGASQSAAALGRPAPHGSGARRSDQGGQEELSHAFEYEAPSQPYPSGPLTSGRDSVGSLLSDEIRQLRDRVYAIEIALGLGRGGQAVAQAARPGALEVLRQDLDAIGRETREPHRRCDRWFPASALKELLRGLDALSYELLRELFPVPSYPPYNSRGRQSVYHSQASPPAAPVVQRTLSRFEEVSSHLGLPTSEEKGPAVRDTAYDAPRRTSGASPLTLGGQWCMPRHVWPEPQRN
ncbi:LOW QUALITY PROTEIN: ATP-binding cassette (ABC) Superfamily [Phytophthora palmivora]|uniref:ATP-binding cassette (ABC) Superfamily n=1 Tax=Phytophthora palmivora TaxID=4796 RepID=A0A2P4YVA5_9STRA|nr:LOW QUALITY PROTEIN: ATP-binding cassette (ABC) Superfamily [Phytophthora palmivora]